MTNDGKVYAMGSNRKGRIGLGALENACEPTLVTEL